MKAIKRILVPTDFSPTANNTLIYALGFAEAVKAEVIILHACRVPSASITAYPTGYHEVVNMNELKQEAEKRMEQLRRDFVYAPRVPYECITQVGPAVDIIERTAEERNVDLLIMGTRQAEGVSAWFGSVTTDTVKHSNYSVLAIPQDARFVPPKKLVFATTLTKLTHLSGVDMLKTVALTFEAAVDILHIHPYGKEYSPEQNRFRDALDKYLEGVPHRFSFVADKDASEGIQQYLDQHDADMLVMLPRHHGLLDGVLHASKTRYMLFHTHKPLLAVKE